MMASVMRGALIAFSGLTLGACQSLPPFVPSGAAQAVCMGQEYLRSNGFLNAVPQDRVILLDTDLRYEVDGVLQYERLVKERRNRFTRKLQGVWTDHEAYRYLLVYGPIDQRQYCLAVRPDVSFVYIRKTCDGEGAFTALRERDVKCAAND